MNKHYQLIEALLFMQGENGLNAAQLQELSNLNNSRAQALLESFLIYFNNQDHGIIVKCFNRTYFFVTKAEFSQQISTLINKPIKKRLSNASLETLAIIAYKGPVTKTQINQIRGAYSDGVIASLLNKGLIENQRLNSEKNQANLYSLTDKFFKHFGIKSLQELPAIEDLDQSEKNEEDFDLFNSQRE